MQLKVEVKGAAELAKTLDSFPLKVEKRIIRTALRKTSKIIQAKAIQNAPAKTGALKSAITIKTSFKKGVMTAKVVIDKKRFPQQYYGAFQEFGTDKMTGKHFLEKAYETSKQEVLEELTTNLAAGIEREAAKENKKV